MHLLPPSMEPHDVAGAACRPARRTLVAASNLLGQVGARDPGMGYERIAPFLASMYSLPPRRIGVAGQGCTDPATSRA